MLQKIGGTAYRIFKNFNIEIGGKTGSAQTGKSTNAWFAGFAPYDNPEIAVVVIIENRWFRKSCVLCSKRRYSRVFWNECRKHRRKFNSYTIYRNAKLKKKGCIKMGNGKHSEGKHSEESSNAKRKGELGLHIIEKSFNREIEETVTKLHNGSLRSGNRVEFEGSIVILRRYKCRSRSNCRRSYNSTWSNKRTCTRRSKRKQKCNNCCKRNRCTTNKNC